MSDLPPGWSRATIGDLLLRIEAGKSFRCEPRPASLSEWGIIKVSAMTWGAFREEENKAVPAGASFNSDYEIRTGDILVSRANTEEYVGAPVLVGRCRRHLLLSDKSLRLVPSDHLNSRWLYYLLCSPAVRSEISRRATGTKDSMRNVSQETLASIRIQVPPLAEQDRIVTVLDDHLSRLEAGASLIKSLMTRSTRLREATLESAVRGTIGTQEQDFGDAVMSVQNIRSSARFDHRELHPLPKGWEWVTAEEVCTTIACGGTPRAGLMYSRHGDVPFLKVYNLTRNGHIDFTVRPTFIDRETHDSQLKRSKVFPGDVLTNIVGPPLGKTVVVPDSYPEWNINQAIVTFRAGGRLSPNWLALVLQAPSVLRRLQSTARATAGQFNIALSTCRALPIPLPPAAEQEQITETVRQVLYAATGAEKGINFCRAREGHLRRRLLAEALAGRLAPQDPRDESASVLVEQISAQRAAQPRAMQGRRTAKRAPQEETLL